MLSTLLLLAPQAVPAAHVQGSNSTAFQHPADATFFLELPDIQALPAAYADSPLWRIATDPDLAAAVSKVSREQVDLGQMLEQLRARITLDNLPPQALEMGLDRFLLDLKNMSASTVLPVDMQAALAPVAQYVAASAQLRQVGAAISNQAFLSESGLPSALDQVEDLDPKLLQDPFGNPLVYALTEASFTVSSLGSDGAPGGSGLNADLVYDGQWNYVEGGVEQAVASTVIEQIGMRILFGFSDPQTSSTMFDRLTEVVRSQGLVQELREEKLVDHDGEEVRAFVGILAQADAGRLPIWMADLHGQLAIGMGGRSELGAFATDLASGFKQGLDTNALFQASQAGLPPASGTTIAHKFSAVPLFEPVLDVVELALETAGPLMPAEVSSQLKPEQLRTQLDMLRKIGAVLAPAGADRTELTQGHFEKNRFTPESVRERSTWIGFEPIEPAVLAMLPADSAMVFAAPIDAAGLAGAIESLLGEQLAANSNALENELGIDLVTDILAHLDPQMVASVGQLRGIGLPRSLVHMKLRDAESFQTGLGKFLGELAAQQPERFEFKDKPYRKMTLFQLGVQLPQPDLSELEAFSVELGAMGPLMNAVENMSKQDVAFGIVGDTLIVGLNSLHVKKELRRLGDASGGRDEEADDEAESSTHPLVSGAIPLPEGVNQALYIDWGAQLASVYDMGKAFGGMAAGFGGAELPIDISALPEAQLFTRHLIPTLSTTVHGALGSLTHTTSSFGPEMALLPGFVGLAAATLGSAVASDFDSEDGFGIDFEEAAWEELPTSAQLLAQTNSTLMRVRTALEVFRYTNGDAYPAELALLSDPTTDFPQGYLDGEALPTDAFGNPFVYTVDASTKTFRLYSVGPNGIDDGGQGDDLVVQ